MKTRLLLALVLLPHLFDGAAHAAQTIPPGFEGRRTVTAYRIPDGESISLDGRLDEPAWRRAAPATGFIQVDPDNGAPPTEPTEVFILYNRDNFYMGMVAHDSEPDQLLGNTMLRDAFLSADDRFMWVLDTYLDERSGYFFEINPSGSMGDSLLGGGGQGRAWDGIWTARVVRSEIGWVAEIEIPFRTLNFDPNREAWGINFQRTVRRKSEESIWNGFARNQTLQTMSNAGLVIGLEDISQGVGLDIRPYVVGNVVSRPGGGSDAVYTGDTGVDFLYSVTPSLRTNFTINTDFAETEVDDRQVNLTRFPLRFPEKRSFFLEGSNFFDFTGYGDAFFSRRIGLTGGTPQRITYGAKMTGQVGAQDIGVLQVRTAEEGSLSGGDLKVGEDFTVFRGRRRLFSESHAGLIYTRRSQRDGGLPAELAADDRHTLGFDARLSTRRFRDNQNLRLSTHYLHTSNPEGGGRSGRFGAALEYPNDLVNAGVRFNETQANFDPAVGFVTRSAVKEMGGNFQLAPRPESHPWIRQYTFGVNFDRITDRGNRLLSRELNVTVASVSLHAGDNFQFRVIPQYERLEDDFRMQGGIVLPAGEEYTFTRYSVNGGMSNRRPVALRGNFNWGGYFSGTRWDFGPGVAIRPWNGMLIDASGQWNRIELPEGSFSTTVLRTRVDTQFSPWISLSNNVQYDTVSRILGWQTRFRWILKPGNDLFFVYTQNWHNDLNGDLETVDRQAASKLVYTLRL